MLKEGIGEDHQNQERLAKLLRFASTTADEGVSFTDYVGRMKEGQEAIYYITADTLAAAKGSPQLEVFRKKGIEVLLFTDRVDEWMLSHLYEFDGKPLQSVAKGGVDLGKLQDEEEKKAAEAAAESFKPVLERLKATLKAVSYTHLDVYKRQVVDCPCARRHAKAAPYPNSSPAGLTLIKWVVQPPGLEFRRTAPTVADSARR